MALCWDTDDEEVVVDMEVRKGMVVDAGQWSSVELISSECSCLDISTQVATVDPGGNCYFLR